MRGWLALGALALLLPFAATAAGHEGAHGLHVTDVRFTYRVPGAYQEVSFVVHNDELGPATEGLRVEVSYVYTFVRDTFELPELDPDSAQRLYLRVPDQVSPYGCVQAFAVSDGGESSDPACVSTSGAGLG